MNVTQQNPTLHSTGYIWVTIEELTKQGRAAVFYSCYYTQDVASSFALAACKISVLVHTLNFHLDKRGLNRMRLLYSSV